MLWHLITIKISFLSKREGLNFWPCIKWSIMGCRCTRSLVIYPSGLVWQIQDLRVPPHTIILFGVFFFFMKLRWRYRALSSLWHLTIDLCLVRFRAIILNDSSPQKLSRGVGFFGEGVGELPIFLSVLLWYRWNIHPVKYTYN